MKSVLWLEARAFKRLFWLNILAPASLYPLFFVLRYYDLELYFGYLPVFLIILLPTAIQTDKFRRIDKAKGLIDYYLIISSARKILLARGVIGAVMGLMILLISLPAVVLVGGWIYLAYPALAVLLAFIYILGQGYSIWYGYNGLSAIFAIAIMIGVIVAIKFPGDILLILIIMLASYGATGILAVIYAERDREAIVHGNK